MAESETEPVIERVGGVLLTVMLRDFEAFWVGEEESVPWTVKLGWPEPVGVPEIVPSLLKLRPEGKEPSVTVHTYGVVPPEAAKLAEYAMPVVPFESEFVLITRPFLGLTSTEKDFCAVCVVVEESETWIEKLNFPTVVGVPFTAPPLLVSASPGGNVPDAIVKLYGETPPVALRAAEYDTPTAVLGKLSTENWTPEPPPLPFEVLELDPEENPLQPTDTATATTMKPNWKEDFSRMGLGTDRVFMFRLHRVMTKG